MLEQTVLYFGSDAATRRTIQYALSDAFEFQSRFLATDNAGQLFSLLQECGVVFLQPELGAQPQHKFELCTGVRRARPGIYLICLAPSNSRTIVDALDAGADDCVDTTADVHELAARIRVALRHSSQPSPNELDAIHEPLPCVGSTFDSVLVDEEGVEVPECESAERIRVAACQLVGNMGLTDAQRLVRKAMTKEALMRLDGNRHAVARLLQVDRRYVLKLIEEHPDIDPRAARVSPHPPAEAEASSRVSPGLEFQDCDGRHQSRSSR
jgi:DNA-binding response OmpR family regulator